jgi:hypothetical protein
VQREVRNRHDADGVPPGAQPLTVLSMKSTAAPDTVEFPPVVLDAFEKVVTPIGTLV